MSGIQARVRGQIHVLKANCNLLTHTHTHHSEPVSFYKVKRPKERKFALVSVRGGLRVSDPSGWGRLHNVHFTTRRDGAERVTKR